MFLLHPWVGCYSIATDYKSEMQKNRCYLTIHSMTTFTLADLFCNSFGVRNFVPEGVFRA